MKSVRAKLMLWVSLLFLLLILLIYCANLFFLDNYYLLRTKSTFIDESHYLYEAYHNDERDFLDVLRERADETGMKYVISHRDGELLLKSSPDFRRGENQKIPKSIGSIIPENSDVFYGIVTRDNSDKKDIFLASPLSRDQILFVSLPLEHLKTNARIANQFLLILGSVIFLFSLIITWNFAKTVVKPVKELTLLSERIEQLDFSHSYRGKRSDEIGRLGTSLNKTKDKLEQTIGELKEEMVLQKRFLASVSHELKSPIALIRGYSEAINLGHAITTADTEEFTSIIISESNRLNLLINDLLQLVQMDSVHFSLTMDKIDLVETTERVLRNNDHPLTKRGLSVVWNHPDKAIIEGDDERMSQVIENLLTNGMKHSADGSEISVDLSAVGDQVRLNVTNVGKQIPEEHLKHLFEPFYSANQGRERATTGSGLGLSIVNSIVEKHGGRCEINNVPRGVRATVHLPAKID